MNHEFPVVFVFLPGCDVIRWRKTFLINNSNLCGLSDVHGSSSKLNCQTRVPCCRRSSLVNTLMFDLRAMQGLNRKLDVASCIEGRHDLMPIACPCRCVRACSCEACVSLIAHMLFTRLIARIANNVHGHHHAIHENTNHC